MANNIEKQYTIETTKLPGSLVEMKGELSWEAFSAFETKTFTDISNNLAVDGFRKGNVPEAVAKKHIDDDMLLAEMAQRAMEHYYPEIVKEQKLDLIGRPDLSITKLARGNALGFTIRAAVLPDITLPDYKALAKKASAVETVEATEEDIDKVVEDLRHMRAYGHVHKGEDASAHGHTEELPEVNDEFAKSFGSFETVASMREKIRENITREKGQEAQDKRRIAIMESIIAETSFDVPDLVLKSEQEKMLAQIEADVARAGFTLDAYLTQSQKTKEGLLDEFKPEAQKRARFQLVINAIARDAKIMPTDEEVEKEADRMIATYPGADKARAMAYADMLLTNEQTLSLLEKQ
ncbi:MAG: trigger factor [Minisyncoccia bacterium]